MRIIIYTCLIFLLFAVTSLPQQPNFLPLEIGNEYQINNGISYFFGIIERDTVYPNGKSYYKLPSPIFQFLDARVDNNGNIFTTSIPFYYNAGNQDEYLIFKSDASDGEIWPVAWGLPVIDTLFAELIITDTWFVFDRLRTIKAILLYTNSVTPYVYVLAEGIGQIREDWDDGTIVVLNYAKVGGTVYGNIVGIDDDETINLLLFRVSQNYPNPFNGETKIDLILPQSSINDTPKLIIYDQLGREVCRLTLVNNNVQTITINTDKLGLSSGIYFYSVLYNNQRLTKKFTLLK
jgi:hypothetical protein